MSSIEASFREFDKDILLQLSLFTKKRPINYVQLKAERKT